MENGNVMQYGFLQDSSNYAALEGYWLSYSTSLNNPFASGDLVKCQAKKVVSETYGASNTSSGSPGGRVTVTETGVDITTCVTVAADVRTDK